MARSPYAIRKGFEYQDLYCGYIILSLIETESLDLEFEIESDEAYHVDDLVVFESVDSVVGHQVKFHVDQEHVESFESLTNRRTPKSKALLEKLYRGWKSLKDIGSTVRVEFVSSNPAEPGRYKLGPAIETATGTFRQKFFDHNDYRRKRELLKALLDVEDDELKNFLSDVVWRLSYESIDGLRRLVTQCLKRLHLPFDEDAIARLMELTGGLSTSSQGRLTLRSFVQRLWAISRFRDACEQQFPSVDFGTSQQRRANTIGVAIVSLESLPAMMGSRYACLEEPFPFPDFRFGISATDREGLLDQNRASWKQEYAEWLSLRVRTILSTVPLDDVDIIIFPRFSLPIEAASVVAEWGRNNRVHAAIGGHSLPDTEKARTFYDTDLNITVPHDEDIESSHDLILDALLRCDRVGRLSISQLDSPYSKSESVIRNVDAVALETDDGWINAVVIPSKSIAREFLGRNPARPEIAIVSSGVHACEAYEELMQNEAFEGLPVLLCSADSHIRPNAQILDRSAPTPAHSDAWEGVHVYSIKYDRSHTGWSASVETKYAIPLVYDRDNSELSPECFESLKGSPASRNDAIHRLQSGHEIPATLCQAESAAEFFYRRAKEAEAEVREKLSDASPQQIAALSKTLEEISKSLESLRIEAMLPIQFTPPPQKLIPQRSSQFFNRAKEKADIGRFFSTTNDNQVLLLHGPPGIGKKELLAEVQRVQADRRNWVRFRCSPDSRLIEILAQLLVRLGSNDAPPHQVDQAVFRKVIQSAEVSGATVVVFEDAHFLPLSRDHQDHNSFLDLLTAFCGDTSSKVKFVLVSDWRGHLQFSGSHRMEVIPVRGLEDEYVVELLLEHLAENPCRFEQPTVDEVSALASKLHGHPFIARLAAVVLEDSPASEVAEKLYARVETRNFVLGRLLGRIRLSEKEQRLLEFASLLRIPVSSEAFVTFGGPSANALLEELLNRFLMVSEDRLYRLHPVLVEFFQTGLRFSDTAKRLHMVAFDYYARLSQRRALTVEEKTEYIYHGVSSGRSIDLADIQMFAGSIRSALDSAVRKRDWAAVEAASSQLMEVWPYDITGQIGMALALDASGRGQEAVQYTNSLEQVTPESKWLAVEFVKSRIWRRDFDGAERNLAVIKQRFSDDPRVVLAEAQLHERMGETDEAVACCEQVLTQPTFKEKDAFLAALGLRDANRLELVVSHLERYYEENGFRNEGLLRLYSVASVLTNHDPQEGLQVLSDLWDASPRDGYVVSDYATALVAIGRVRDAASVLERGVFEVPKRSRGYRPLLETYAFFYEKQEKFVDAFRMYREAIAVAPNHLHVYRSFARCLLTAAASYGSQSNSAQEDSAVAEARQVLGKLLQIAPLDRWAADALQRAEQRTYKRPELR